jgi:putative ABC transport system permease protein
VVQVFDTSHVSASSVDFEAEKEYVPVQYPVANGMSVAELQQKLGAINGVKEVLPRITAFATLQDSTIKHAFLWGIDIEKETVLNNLNLTDKTDGLVEGRYPAPNTNECAIGVRMAKKAGLKIGDTVPLKTMSSQFSDRMWAPTITGIFEYDYIKYDEGVILVDFTRLQRLLALGDATQQIYVYAEKESMSRGIANQARVILGSDTVVREWNDHYFVAMMKQSEALFVVIYVVFLIVASFLIVNTVVMIIHERIKEIGMMGSLGMTRSEIVEVFFFEALFLSIIGSLAGVFIGGVATFFGSLFPLNFDAMTGGGFKDYPISSMLTLAFSPAILLQGFIFGVVISGICTLIPSLKSAFIAPVEALRR